MKENITIRVSRVPSTIQYNARLNLAAGLYENEDFMFYSVLQEPKSIIKMATLIHNRKRIGTSILWDYEHLDEYKGDGFGVQLGCYVKPEFRRQHFGSQMIKRMKTRSPVGIGSEASGPFWESVFENPIWFGWYQ